MLVFRIIGPIQWHHQPVNLLCSSIPLLLLIVISFLFALTGFVCTHKIQAEEECLSSNVLCYECDSRYDPNCDDPFDFPSPAFYNQDANKAQQQASISRTSDTINETTNLVIANSSVNSSRQQQTKSLDLPNDINSTISTNQQEQPWKSPNVVNCHGCCVKITSKMPDGAAYVKRTCTTNLQINYFMVGLVCMKESGDRGKMCFCENDYCNGQQSSFDHLPKTILFASITISLLCVLRVFSYQIQAKDLLLIE